MPSNGGYDFEEEGTAVFVTNRPEAAERVSAARWLAVSFSAPPPAARRTAFARAALLTFTVLAMLAIVPR